MSAIIYLITNTINGKQYVGQTRRELDARWYDHCMTASYGGQWHLACAIRKYGPEVFNREILENLEDASDEYINERERYWRLRRIMRKITNIIVPCVNIILKPNHG